MRLLFLGDVVGKAGRKVVLDELPGLVARWRLEAVVVNGENAAGGFGITEVLCQELIDAGADVVTLGNHAWDQKEALVFIERQPRLVRPANYPSGTAGRGATLVDLRNGARLLAINVMGRVFMDAMDDPFVTLDRELEACPLGVATDAILIDVHAETTSEKQAIAHFCDGRASLVVGTHTHVPTADHRLLPGGTAYCTDAGMCGDYDSIIGMDKGEPMQRFLRKINTGRFEPASGPATLTGVAVEVGANGLARGIWPVRIGGLLARAAPPWDEPTPDRP
jgi:2',3'-cyclic-nucleotide 2'-phosphodiesterase